MAFCSKCGAQSEANQRFCVKCGNDLSAGAPPAPVAEVPAPESIAISPQPVVVPAEQVIATPVTEQPTITGPARHPLRALLALVATLGFFVILALVFQRC